MSRRRIAREHALRLEAEYANVILVVEHDELVGAELEFADRGPARECEGGADAALAVDVDEARAEAGVGGADGEEGLDGVVGEGGDLGVDAVAGEL
jgi:hypothetical protein